MPEVKSKYHRKIARNSDGESDVYDVLRAFNVTDPAIAHAVKKLLMPGQRNVAGKTVVQDLNEAKWSIECAIDALQPMAPPAPGQTTPYNMGEQAFEDGKDRDANPCGFGPSHDAWERGFRDAQQRAGFPDV